MGTSSHRTARHYQSEDHPHACGDKRNGQPFLRRSPGSSPRVWGQACLFANGLSLGRIIPTRVGTSAVKKAKEIIEEDHPHACGDKLLCQVCTQHSRGSSPRVWGQESTVQILYRSFGIIPTRVGTRASLQYPQCP